jgi:hypothetical protein
MESIEHQEWRARQEVSVAAIFKAGTAVGAALFIFSGGTPWSTAGTANAVMGRMLGLPYVWMLVVHMALAWIYMGILAMAIYRLHVLPAIAAGVGVSLGLYIANWLLVSPFVPGGSVEEMRVLLVHVVFGIFGSVTYKALAVPKPNDDERHKDEIGPDDMGCL